MARIDTSHLPRPAAPTVAPWRERERLAIAQIDALIAARRTLRAQSHPGTAMSVDDQGKVAALEREIDECWLGLRRDRAPLPMPVAAVTVARR